MAQTQSWSTTGSKARVVDVPDQDRFDGYEEVEVSDETDQIRTRLFKLNNEVTIGGAWAYKIQHRKINAVHRTFVAETNSAKESAALRAQLIELANREEDAGAVSDAREQIDLLKETTRSNERHGLNALYRWVLEATGAKNWKLLNSLLDQVDLGDFPLSLQLGFLASTYLGRAHLPSREALGRKIRKSLRREFSDAEVNRMLKGLV